MPDLRPFRGIRYSSAKDLEDLVCPPYDVISAEEQARLHRRHPHNAVHLELALGNEKYKKAAATFAHWLRAGVLRRDEHNALYVYRQDFVRDGARHRIVGAIGALTLEPLSEAGGILPHERTMPGPIEDRLALLRACPVNISPIYAIYRGGGILVPFFESLQHRAPVFSFTGDDGALHRGWVISEPSEIDLLAGAVSQGPLVIADGHHRYETALAYHEEQAGRPGAHDAAMCFCVDADAEDLLVLPYHRAVSAPVEPGDLHERMVEGLGAMKLAGADPVEAIARSPADHAFAFVLRAGELVVEMPSEEVAGRLPGGAPAWRDLDVVALHEVVLPELFPEGIDELRFSTHLEDIVRLVREEGWVAGVLLRPLDPVQVVEVASSGGRMPQKASYFWPKALTGLVFRSLSGPDGSESQ